jgi:hypothetical protein
MPGSGFARFRGAEAVVSALLADTRYAGGRVSGRAVCIAEKLPILVTLSITYIGSLLLILVLNYLYTETRDNELGREE